MKNTLSFSERLRKVEQYHSIQFTQELAGNCADEIDRIEKIIENHADYDERGNRSLVDSILMEIRQ